ncbi:MAG: nitrate- and nitrite sensing domain-containing protein [Umezawaea sp.]
MTSIESGPSWVERLNPRHWTLVWKLVIVGLVPALLALTLGVLRIADQAGSAADLGRSGRLLEARNEIVAASGALRLERDQATLYAASNGTGDRAAFDTSRQRSDQALNTMRSGLAASNADLEPATMAALQRTQDSLGLISSLRQSVTGTPTRPYDQIVNRYTNVIGTIDVLDRAILRQQRTQATAGLADASSAVTSALEQLSIQHAILAGAIRAGKPLPGDPAVVNAATAQLVNNYRDYQAALTPEQLAKFGNLPDTSATSRMDQLRSAILTAPFQLGPLARDWDTAYDQARESTDRTAGLISAELSATAAAAAQRASNLAGINSVILMLGLLVGIAIAVLVARSLIRSLRLLRSSALDVAERRLPQAVESMRAGEAPDAAVEPVPIGTRDEVGQVARAFDAVQREAVRLAVEQVALRANVNDMFINLSRRSQALVERQIGVIDRLEQDEQDPDQLASLFELDHLATQMRRNSENLLVLSGTTVNRRVTRPVPVSEVLGAAVSEVEKYARIQIAPGPEIKVQGRVVNDLAHLIAELLDNATAFSKPTTKVTVRATETRRGEIAIRIHDRGVGMQDNDIIEANHKLSEPPEVDVSVAREMGLYVVGQLAKRHEIRVTLTNNDDIEGGVTAQVVLPVSLLHKGASQLPPPPPARASSASSFEQHLSGQGQPETTGVGVIAGVPKWTPGQADFAQTESGQFPQVMRTPDEDPHAEHLVERTSTEGLFTSTFAGTPSAPDGVEQIDYSYPPAAERTALPRKPPAKPKVEPVTERLPIYEDVLSRWFQGGETTEPPGKGTAAPAPAANGNGKAGGSEATELFAPVGVLETPAQRNSSPALPKREVQDTPPMPMRKKAPRLDQLPIPEAAPSTSKATADWGGADEGWQTANKVLKTAVDDKTTAGLPKRVPNARLIPGSPKQQAAPAKSSAPSGQSGPSGQSASVATTAPPRRRSAERLRQQFATYQRGVQMGRESLDDVESWDSPLFSTTSGDMSAEKEQQ